MSAFVLQDYLNLIPGPTNGKPKFMKWFQGTCQVLIDTQSAINSMIPAFDIANAVGARQDIIGQILGVSRTVDFIPPGGLNPVLDDDLYRVVLYAKILKNQWKGTVGEIYNFWHKFLPQYPILIQDKQNMTMHVSIYGTQAGDTTGEVIFSWNEETSTHKGWNESFWGGAQDGMLKNLIVNHYFMPKPAGVLVTYSFPTQPLFSFNVENSNFKGWNEGYWP